jgi:putative oxidoreductase
MRACSPRGIADPIRLVVGSGFAYHGAPKLFTAKGHENITKMLTDMGVPLPEAAGWGVGVLEFFGGLALVFRKRTKLAAAVVVGEVVINLITAAVRGGFPEPIPGGQPLPGWESSFFYGGGALTVWLAELAEGYNES